MHFTHAMLTDVGRVRTRNEDLAAAEPKAGIFMLADGMGGHPAGNLAARIAVDSAMHYLVARGVPGRPRGRGEKLRGAILAANRAILETAEVEAGTAGMGTTLSAVWLGKRHAHVGHVGDSRIYRVRDGKIERLTRDHTVVRELVERGEIEDGSIEAKRMGHILTQAVGLEDLVLPDVNVVQARPGDVFLLCSDGLSDTVDDSVMAELIGGAGGDLQKAASELVQAALDTGGHDNVTVVLARIDE